MKKIAVILTLALMLCSMPMTVFAESAESYAASTPATPNWTLTVSARSSLYIDSTTVTCTSVVTGGSSVTKITVTQTLQKEGFLWIYYTYDDDSEWSTFTYNNIIHASNNKTGLTSGKYRLKSVFTLKSADGRSETITVYSDPIVI